MKSRIMCNCLVCGRQVLLVVVIMALQFSFWGCTHLGGMPKHKVRPTFVRVEGISRVFVEGEIVRMSTGQVVTFEEMMAELRSVRIVYVGETHVNSSHHDIQLKVLEALFKNDQPIHVGMEMFGRSYQAVLDRWSSGGYTEKTFLKKVEWEERWSFDFDLYRAILLFVRENHIPLTPLNVPIEIVRKVATRGIESLSANERAQIAEDIDLSDDMHRAFLKRQYAGHDTDDLHGFEYFHEAQSVWDDSMAESVAKIVKTDQDDSQIVVFAGNGHIEKFGIPERVQRRVTSTYLTLMPASVGSALKQNAADYVWVTKLQKMHRHPLIGIKIKPVADSASLLIEGVLPESPAESAGMKKGDILLAIDGAAVSSVSDIHRAVLDAKSRGSHLFQIKRGEETLELEVTPKNRREGE